MRNCNREEQIDYSSMEQHGRSVNIITIWRYWTSSIFVESVSITWGM